MTPMMEQYFEIKKDCLFEAFNCLDLVAQNGSGVKSNPQFTQSAKQAYNGLLCVVNSPKLYQEFYRMTLDQAESVYSIEDVEAFKISCRAELVTKRKNKNDVFKDYSVGFLHGKMKKKEKEQVMQEFKDGKVQIIVSTTVIEVGVDIPNATVIVIFDADRFGLSTLHQLRGRVGRGTSKSQCILISDSDAERLKIMETVDDGVFIFNDSLRVESINSKYNIIPVITVKNSLLVTFGEGSMDSPYIIN